MSGPIDLSQLPPPRVVETLDYEAILAERKARLLDLIPADQRAEITAVLELESEPLTKLLEENSYRELVWRRRVNEAAQAVLLPHAAGADLDAVAALTNTERLVIGPGDPEATPPVPPSYESDAALRIRAQEAWEGLSPGTRLGYEHAARGADGRVRDVRALSPAPAEVSVVVLSHATEDDEGDGRADAALLAAVEARLLDEDGPRIIGDRLQVISAEIVDYAIQARLRLYDDAAPTAELILAEARRRTDEFVAVQHRLSRPLGVPIYRDGVMAAMHVPGVMHVELTEPSGHLLIEPTQAARCTGIEIELGGDDAG